MSLISADQARTQSQSFDLTQQQVLDQIAKLIDGNSKVGKKEVVVQFLKSAVSKQELENSLAQVRGAGYSVELIEAKSESEKFSVKINW
ncbi:hypothetical protein [Idiomarina sp.]|uniref:hypothetical protein n=1 Tax=Idiomarina sp. TaxID=1874361 RepID=UPI0025BEDF45|nr:hypothetical protein [Idiomarina sp.]